MPKNLTSEIHAAEIQKNLRRWDKKPLLRVIYRKFYRLIATETDSSSESVSVEIGSGIGNIKDVIPNCLRTDIVENPWLDQTENAYALSFETGTIDNLILFDVFHHLKHPATALEEFKRVLKPGGRVILFEPCISMLGRLVYGLMHPEPLALNEKIEWQAPANWNFDQLDYYAAQGNATRMFVHGEGASHLNKFVITKVTRLSALTYIGSGGYSGPQLYPNFLYKFVLGVEKVLDFVPLLFATRLLVVLEPNQEQDNDDKKITISS